MERIDDYLELAGHGDDLTAGISPRRADSEA